VDYLTLYVIPKNVWYIIPTVIAVPKHTIQVRPSRAANQYERYREAWHLLHDSSFRRAAKAPLFPHLPLIEDPPPSAHGQGHLNAASFGKTMWPHFSQINRLLERTVIGWNSSATTQ
jgi:hypothetical protein